MASMMALAMVAAPLGMAMAQDSNSDVTFPSAPSRPEILSNRWEEDWSPLADPALRTEPFDALKYIPLLPSDPKSYMSFGMTLRERFEDNDTPSFGIGPAKGDSYLLQRYQFHIDVHLNEDWQLFSQFEDVRAFDKKTLGPADQNPLDLRLAFLGYSHSFDAGTFKARVGRQDFLFDLQRFVSSRDGPNVRQSFDAAWADWETGPWRFIGFVSQPVQYDNGRVFDDSSDHHFRFSTLRVERHVFGTNELSAYFSRYDRDDAQFVDASGTEHRNILDARFAGQADNVDWDLEAMGQTGDVGSKKVRAWALGARAGYTFSDIALQPRLGLQFDMASGDRHRGDDTVGTFNPLFPNGYYFTLAGYTGYANLIHLKPSVTASLTDDLTLMGAIGLLWRETTADAVYVQPSNPVAGTAGEGGSWTGYYGQIRADYKISANLAAAVEAVHYDVGDAIRRAGGRDADYLGVELKAAW